MSSSTHSEGSTKELRAWMKAEMDLRGWSNARLARELEVFKGTVGRWLAEDDDPMQRRPSYESCRRLAELFGKDMRSVLEMAGIDEFEGEKNVTRLQRDVMSLIPLIPDRMLTVVQPQLKALIDDRIQQLVEQQLAATEIVERGAPPKPSDAVGTANDGVRVVDDADATATSRV